MAKAKIKEESLIHVEVGKLASKVKEFQDYLDQNPIVSQVTLSKDLEEGDDGIEIDLSIERQDKLHKEILIQGKMIDNLFNWLPALAKLRETEAEKELETRGDVKIPGIFKNQK